MKQIQKTSEGIIFDLQRCSMYDGPGIRTTIFFKGCPLSCKWCHNPESQSRHPQLAFYEEKCIQCQACSSTHPQVHEFKKSSVSMVHTVQYSNCTQCGKCVDVCPSSALKIFGYTAAAEDLIRLVLRDIPYYKETGGGLTISGGEPFFQYSFLLELLKTAKNNNISTCVETCGYVTTQKLNEALPYIDFFLYDYKETSPVRHKQFTGVDNVLILNNLDFLYHSGKSITLRCPIIPGYNDTPEHFRGIAAIEQKYPNLNGIEILPYHDMGKAKATAIGASYQISDSTADSELKAKWKEMMLQCKCSSKVLDSF